MLPYITELLLTGLMLGLGFAIAQTLFFEIVWSGVQYIASLFKKKWWKPLPLHPFFKMKVNYA